MPTSRHRRWSIWAIECALLVVPLLLFGREAWSGYRDGFNDAPIAIFMGLTFVVIAILLVIFVHWYLGRLRRQVPEQVAQDGAIWGTHYRPWTDPLTWGGPLTISQDRIIWRGSADHGRRTEVKEAMRSDVVSIVADPQPWGVRTADGIRVIGKGGDLFGGQALYSQPPDGLERLRAAGWPIDPALIARQSREKTPRTG
jgi:hypothetical protein